MIALRVWRNPQTGLLRKALVGVSMLALMSCAKDSETSHGLRASQSQLRSANNIQLWLVGDRYALVALPDVVHGGEYRTAYVLDWGPNKRPSNLNLPSFVDAVSEQQGELYITENDGTTSWRFTVLDGVINDVPGRVCAVVGLSRMTWDKGYDMTMQLQPNETDPFEALRARRKDYDRQGDAQCTSGGPGSNSCSTTGVGVGNGNSCSVSCSAGFYACCDMVLLTCTCKPNN